METKKNNIKIYFANFLVLLLLICETTTFAQFSLGGGLSSVMAYGRKSSGYGLNFVAELPRNNDLTFTGSITYTFPREINQVLSGTGLPAIAKDPNTTPQNINLPIFNYESINYLIVSAGQRFYILNGFDEGFSLYGGTMFGFTFNKVKWRQTVQYDDSKYTVDSELLSKWSRKDEGSILRIQVAFNGGMKYTIPNFGSFFFDAGLYLTLLPMISSEDVPMSLYQSVYFNANIGFRKELY